MTIENLMNCGHGTDKLKSILIFILIFILQYCTITRKLMKIHD